LSATLTQSKRPAGYLLASIMLMKAVTLLTAVWAMAILIWLRNVGGELHAVMIIGIADLIGMVLAAWFFASAVEKTLPENAATA
jgi:hypothetical protein